MTSTRTLALSIVFGGCLIVTTLGVLQMVGVINQVGWVALSMLGLATMITVFNTKGWLPRSRQR